MDSTQSKELVAEAIYDILLGSGYARSKSDFGKICEVALGNVYNYLPNRESGRQTEPLVPTLDQVGQWIERIRKKTRLNIALTVSEDVRVIADGYDQFGAAYGPVDYSCPRRREEVES